MWALSRLKSDGTFALEFYSCRRNAERISSGKGLIEIIPEDEKMDWKEEIYKSGQYRVFYWPNYELRICEFHRLSDSKTFLWQEVKYQEEEFSSMIDHIFNSPDSIIQKDSWISREFFNK